MKICKECNKEHNKRSQYCDESCKKIVYYKNNKPKIIEKNKLYRINNIEIVSEQNRKRSKNWYIKNKNNILARAKIYYINNKSSIITRIGTYTKNRYSSDINFKLTRILRSRLSSAIKNNHKTGSAVNDLGCSINKFKIHLQLKFIRNPRDQKQIMTWENYGEWHIDHIKPLSKFDLTNPEELKKACHYSNLQPMWAKDNIKKGNTIPQELIYAIT